MLLTPRQNKLPHPLPPPTSFSIISAPMESNLWSVKGGYHLRIPSGRAPQIHGTLDAKGRKSGDETPQGGLNASTQGNLHQGRREILTVEEAASSARAASHPWSLRDVMGTGLHSQRRRC